MRENSIDFSPPCVTFGITISTDFVHDPLLEKNKTQRFRDRIGPRPKDSVIVNPENKDSFTSATSGLRRSLFIGLNSEGDNIIFSLSKVTDRVLRVLLAQHDEKSS
jgi:hypothetical protein